MLVNLNRINIAFLITGDFKSILVSYFSLRTTDYFVLMLFTPILFYPNMTDFNIIFNFVLLLLHILFFAIRY